MRYFPNQPCINKQKLFIAFPFLLRIVKNSEDHSPCANANYINVCILCYDCLDLLGRSKTSKARRRLEKDGKDQKTV